MEKILNKRFYIALLLVLVIVSAAVILAFGKEYVFSDTLYSSEDMSGFSYTMDHGGVIEVTDIYTKGSKLFVKVKYVAPGKDYIVMAREGDHYTVFSAYAHKCGIITDMYYLGNSTGSWIIPVCVVIYLAFVLWGLILKYRKDCSEDLYQYKNITTLGLIVFIAFLLLLQIEMLLTFQGPYMYIYRLIMSGGSFSLYSFPIALVLSICITVSNFNLMRKEGRNPRNMLGIALGLLLIIAIVAPSIISDIVYNHSNIDVHRETGAPRHIMMFIENGMSALAAYLECILIGTIGVALRAAKHIPAFDKDCIVIHGSKIRDDGGLTKLLQERADRAVEFSRMQKEATGKDIVFIPSGGKGTDEIISEADAIKNYLVGIGIPDDHILAEDKSVNTLENIKFSYQLMKERLGGSEPNMAISTTNYHVCRAGMYASELGIKAEGIGSRTKRYFWVNAFIREFVATINSERKRHASIIAALLLIVLVMVFLLYISVQI